MITFLTSTPPLASSLTSQMTFANPSGNTNRVFSILKSKASYSYLGFALIAIAVIALGTRYFINQINQLKSENAALKAQLQKDSELKEQLFPSVREAIPVIEMRIEDAKKNKEGPAYIQALENIVQTFRDNINNK